MGHGVIIGATPPLTSGQDRVSVPSHPLPAEPGGLSYVCLNVAAGPCLSPHDSLPAGDLGPESGK